MVQKYGVLGGSYTRPVNSYIYIVAASFNFSVVMK